MEGSNVTDLSTKKLPLEELSKEDLVKKCKVQLVLLQKAKQSKDAILQENDELKQKLTNLENNNEISKELIETLTQQKLDLVTKLEALRTEKDTLSNLASKCQEQLHETKNNMYELGIEVESQKRQISRLTEENEQLLVNLEDLTSKVENLKKINCDQEDKLLNIKQNVNVDEKKNGELSELQKMLNISLEEIKKLQGENVTVRKENDRLNNVLVEKDEHINNTSKELNEQLNKMSDNNELLILEKEELLKKLHDVEIDLNDKKGKIETNEIAMDDLNTEFHKNRALLESLQKDLEKTNKKLSDNQIFSSGIASDLEHTIEKLQNKLKQYDVKIFKFADYVKSLKHDKNNILNDFKAYTQQVKVWSKQLEVFAHNLLNKMEVIEKEKIDLSELFKNQLAELQAENKSLKDNVPSFNDSANQTDDCILKEFEETINKLKRENSELLIEMNEMNQALKERGETISKQQSYCDEVVQKLQEYEAQENKNVNCIGEKNEAIQKLQQEVQVLKESCDMKAKNDEINRLRSEVETYKEKLNSSYDSNYPESETMSTSTISRLDDVGRIKDLESSWEERYGKLRNLAVKLKSKIRDISTELTKEQNEKSDLQQKLSNSIKSVQSLQAQCDKLQDDLDKSRNEAKHYLKEIDATAQAVSKSKQQLAENDETLTKLRSDIDSLTKEKHNVENWKKQVSMKVQSLKKELELNAKQKMDCDNQIDKLKKDLEGKDQLLKTEIEKHKQTKNSLQELSNELKKKSVLNLEMQDYEKSVKELSQKLEKKQELITKLKNQIDSQKSSVNKFKEQNKFLEESIESETLNLKKALMELTAHKQKINELEQLIATKDDKIKNLSHTLETARSENEDLSTELSKIVAEHQKLNSALKTERDNLRSHNFGLEQKLLDVQDQLKVKEEELKTVESEYHGYKIRAQSVLRQSQSRDVGLEEKLEEEMASLKTQVALLETKDNEYNLTIATLTKDNEKLLLQNKELLSANSELQNKIKEQNSLYDQLTCKHEQMINDHAETIRGLRVQSDTLVQCYRQQISEQEVRHNREIIELQSKLDKAPSPSSELPLPLPSMPREEGEGSESVESVYTPNTHPLEKILGDDYDHELTYIKKQLYENESKVAHLTAILADTEQDLAKHVQMNKLLKEEIRRQQRSVEREKHAENLEYLKNVVFKFLTLGTGDERTQLVPVLNTILKLSPEETNKLLLLAKGDPGIRGWTNYLPLSWPKATKPQ